MDYKHLYLKYKKKYLIEKKKSEQNGGGKRFLKSNVNEEDILTITPIGSPKQMNNFLLLPEINYILKKCSKESSFKRFCKKEEISDILTQIYKIEMNNGLIKDNIKKIKSKSTTEFVQNVVKHHNQWKNDNFISEK